MRFLKNKIRKAKEALERSSSSSAIKAPLPLKFMTGPVISTSTTSSHIILAPQVIPKRKRGLKVEEKKEKSVGCKSTKNIVINYGKAIAGFASSETALPYLTKIVEKEGVTLEGFLSFAAHAKESIGGIASFRSFLVENEGDDKGISGYKRSFQKIAIVFIKYFSVNWIFHGRVSHKIEYLKYRFRMLRRVENPQHFTYIR